MRSKDQPDRGYERHSSQHRGRSGDDALGKSRDDVRGKPRGSARGGKSGGSRGYRRDDDSPRQDRRDDRQPFHGRGQQERESSYRRRGSAQPGRGSSQRAGRGGTRGGGKSDRGGAGRNFTEAERIQHALRPVRAEHRDPLIPEDVTPKQLHPAARNELKTLQGDVQERVAQHLVMVARLIDEDPELAHQHALSASRRAGRIPVARETLAMTAYRLGDFALALRELRTYRRLSGRDDQIAIMVDCERGLGRPQRGMELGLETDQSRLGTEERVHLANAMSGARLDLGQTTQALFELEIPELQAKKFHSWSSELFSAYAAVLEDLGRAEEASKWDQLAARAAAAVAEPETGHYDNLEVIEVVEDQDVRSESEEALIEHEEKSE